MYKITEEYLTGIPLIDEEHTYLFELCDQAYELLHQEFIPDKYDHLQHIFQELTSYTEKHFSDEEAYMEQIDYPAIFIQKAQHKLFIQKLNEIDAKDFEEQQDELLMDILTFLTDWLYNHILKLDKLIGQS